VLLVTDTPDILTPDTPETENNVDGFSDNQRVLIAVIVTSVLALSPLAGGLTDWIDAILIVISPVFVPSKIERIPVPEPVVMPRVADVLL